MLDYSVLYPQNNACRRCVSLDGMWKFRIDPDYRGLQDNWQNGLDSYDLLPVPASFADFYTDTALRDFCGDFWYETEVFVPDEWRGKEIDIRFGSVTHRAEVFLNGQRITYHEGGFLPFCARITDLARYGEHNRLSVRANNELSPSTLPCGTTTINACGHKRAKPFFDFFNYAGIQRSVWLTAAPRESIFDFTLSYQLDNGNATVSYSVVTTGSSPVTVQLADADGNIVARSDGKDGTLSVPDARLWRVRDAYLYTLTVIITDGNNIIDTYSQDIGIRTVEVRNNHFFINGEPVYLKGFCKHEDSDVVGRGFNIGMMKRDFELMKWSNANSFRTSHYPYSEEIYQMADREGFLVIDEVPAVGHSLVNFDRSKMQFEDTAFSQASADFLMKTHLLQIEEMVTRDKNHPCVIAWSLFNEPDTVRDDAPPYFERIFDFCASLDVQKRPRTYAQHIGSSPQNCKCWHFTDFVSLNRYYGWYDLGSGDLEADEAAYRKEMDAWSQLVGSRPVVMSEYGCDTSSQIDKLPGVMWSQEYQIQCLEMCHRVFDSYPFVAGEHVWNFADFQTHGGVLRMDGNKKGIFTRQRQPKRAAFYLKSRWEALPEEHKLDR